MPCGRGSRSASCARERAASSTPTSWTRSSASCVRSALSPTSLLEQASGSRRGVPGLGALAPPAAPQAPRDPRGLQPACCRSDPRAQPETAEPAAAHELQRERRAGAWGGGLCAPASGCAPSRAGDGRSGRRRSRSPRPRGRSRRRHAARPEAAWRRPARGSRAVRRASPLRHARSCPTMETARRSCSARAACARCSTASRHRSGVNLWVVPITTSCASVSPCAMRLSNGPAYGRAG